MYKLIWWNGVDLCGSIRDDDFNKICTLADALRTGDKKWKICVIQYSTFTISPAPGFEKEFEEYKKVYES